MTKKINGKNLFSEDPNFDMVFLGSGNTAYFFIANTSPAINNLILTNHAPETSVVKEGPYDSTQDFETASSIEFEKLKLFILRSIHNKRDLVFSATCPHQRTEYWLDLILNYNDGELVKLIKESGIDVTFFFPEPPNPCLKKVSELDFHKNILTTDSFQAAGRVRHDMEKDASYVSNFTYKTKVNYAFSAEKTSLPQEKKQTLIKVITLNQEVTEFSSHMDHALVECGIPVHYGLLIAHLAANFPRLTKKEQDAITNADSSDEVYDIFLPKIKELSREELIKEYGKVFQHKKFYADSPVFGTSVIIRDISSLMMKIRKILIQKEYLSNSNYDEISPENGLPNGSSINLLLTRYKENYQKTKGLNPLFMNPGSFVRQNPNYLPRDFPVGKDGFINTNDRFFTEPLETAILFYLLGKSLSISEKELEPLRSILEVFQKLLGVEYVKLPEGNIQLAAPKIICELCLSCKGDQLPREHLLKNIISFFNGEAENIQKTNKHANIKAPHSNVVSWNQRAIKMMQELDINIDHLITPVSSDKGIGSTILFYDIIKTLAGNQIDLECKNWFDKLVKSLDGLESESLLAHIGIAFVSGFIDDMVEAGMRVEHSNPSVKKPLLSKESLEFVHTICKNEGSLNHLPVDNSWGRHVRKSSPRDLLAKERIEQVLLKGR